MNANRTAAVTAAVALPRTAAAWETLWTAYVTRLTTMRAAYIRGDRSARLLRGHVTTAWCALDAWCTKHGETNPATLANHLD